MLEQTTEIRTLDDGRVLVLLSGSAYGTLEFAGIEGFKLYMEHCREYLEEKGREAPPIPDAFRAAFSLGERGESHG